MAWLLFTTFGVGPGFDLLLEECAVELEVVMAGGDS